MKKFLNNNIFSLLSKISKELDIETFVVGGYVRDCLIGKKRKLTDIDIVCNHKATDLAKQIANQLKTKNISIYKNFGTALVKYGDLQIEFISARKEYYNKSSRKPEVVLGSMEDDQNRRDFTINAMSISLNEYNFGTLIDPFNGLKDLNDKIIKTPQNPSKTFTDDPLRMFRAIRFANQLGFIIETETLKAIKDNRERITILSKERMLDEFEKILLSEKPSIGLNLLYQTGILKLYFKEFYDLQGVETVNNHSHKDNFFHTLEVIDNVRKKAIINGFYGLHFYMI